jgi:hypothetical protein
MSVSDTDWQLLSARVTKLEDANKNQRWRFVKDDDGHNYLIDAEKAGQFFRLLSEDECEFNLIFDECRIDGVGSYTFENPREGDWF